MTDIKRYIEGKTQEELIETQRNSVVDGDVYKAVTFEIQKNQQDTNNIQIANLIGEIQKLGVVASRNSTSSQRFARWSLVVTIAALVVSGMQAYLALIGVGPILKQQNQEDRRLYENCKEPGNWSPVDGGSTPESTCKEEYLNLRGKFGNYRPAEDVLKRSIH